MKKKIGEVVEVYAVFSGSVSITDAVEESLKEYWDSQVYYNICDAAIDLSRDGVRYGLGDLTLYTVGEGWRVGISFYGVDVKGNVPPEILSQAKKVHLAWNYL